MRTDCGLTALALDHGRRCRHGAHAGTARSPLPRLLASPAVTIRNCRRADAIPPWGACWSAYPRAGQPAGGVLRYGRARLRRLPRRHRRLHRGAGRGHHLPARRPSATDAAHPVRHQEPPSAGHNPGHAAAIPSCVSTIGTSQIERAQSARIGPEPHAGVGVAGRVGRPVNKAPVARRAVRAVRGQGGHPRRSSPRRSRCRRVPASS